MSKTGTRRGTRRATTVCVLACLALASGVLAPTSVGAEELEWTVYAGRWGLEKDGETSEAGFEFLRPLRPLGSVRFDLVGGLAATADEAIWAYTGVSLSWEPTAKWRMRPGFAISVFENGDGKDLGGPIEFRSSIEATYRVRQSLRLGLLLYHLSNAGIYDLNPGSNSLVLVLGFP